MEPARAQALVRSLPNHVEQAVARGRRPVLICSARVRRHLRRLCEQALPQLAGLRLQRDRAGIGVETTGVVEGAGVPVAA